jgi:hypothetical protein
MWSSLARSTASELNDGKGVGPSGRGATPSSGEAPAPTHEDGGGVRRLDTDSVVENRGEHCGDGLPEADKGAGADEMQQDGPLL